MNTIIFLILFPLLPALLMLLLPHGALRKTIMISSAACLIGATIYQFITAFHLHAVYYTLDMEWITQLMMIINGLVGIYLVYLSIKAKKYLVTMIVALQTLGMMYFEITMAPSVTVQSQLFTDQLSVIMAFIIGSIGSLICIYAIGYMKDYHDHQKEIKDKRNSFFFIMFLFLSAMFGLIFSNDLLWLYFFWEITTLCSFLLIGYSNTKEATDNAFRALLYNLIGGLGFGIGIIILFQTSGTIELNKLIGMGKAAALLPAIFISFAGLAKSAQMPFSSWLLGAMVAPTPTSALLHSSTMVKAGVYIIIRMSPLLQNTPAGLMVSLIGGTTFLAASFIAATHSNAKKLLAYSTIANLGLIVACAGIGTYEAVWAAILLIIFHAIAKSLLFLSVGTAEHTIGSQDIEDMSGLITRVPRLALAFIIGIAGMFLAPFGMLISKWAAMKAFIDSNPLLLFFLVFGSSVTLLYWTKWMGKLLVIKRVAPSEVIEIRKEEWATLSILSGMTIAVCALFPWISSLIIEPYSMDVFGKTVILSQGNDIIMATMLAVVLLLPFSLLFYKGKIRYVDPYLCGSNVESITQFQGSLGAVRNMNLQNYYLGKFFNEKIITQFTVIICILLIIVMFGVEIL